MKVKIKDAEYEGTCTEIVDQLRFQNDETNEYPDTESYILQMKINLVRETGKVCIMNPGFRTKKRLLLSWIAGRIGPERSQLYEEKRIHAR